jgi:hypothetical protein
MKLLLFLLLTATAASAQVSDRLLNAIEQVESHGNASAIGDQGRALGSMQIWQCVVTDANRIAGTNYKHADAFDREKARTMARAYLNYYGRRIGHAPTDQDYARIWNGGPSGHKKTATLGYWAKIKKELTK